MSIDEDLDALWNDNPPPRRVARPAVAVALSSDSDSGESVGGGGGGETASPAELDQAHDGGAAAPSTLPAAAEILDEVSRPDFLDPEATRQLASLERLPPKHPSALAAALQQKEEAKGKWDISRMAPAIAAAYDEASKAGVISAAAVRYKGDQESHAAAGPGGHLAALGPAAGASEGQEKAAGKRKATAAMAVEDFLEKGVGGAQLPRKRQERKDREKEKRGKGQSTHAEWKSEAEMVLRQQFD